MTRLSEDLPRSSSSSSHPSSHQASPGTYQVPYRLPATPPGKLSEETELREVVVQLEVRQPRPSSSPCTPALPPSWQQHCLEIQTRAAAATLAAAAWPRPCPLIQVPPAAGAREPRLLWLLHSQELWVLLLGKEQSSGSGSRDVWSRSLVVVRDPAL